MRQPAYEATIPCRATRDAISRFAEEQRTASGIKHGFDLPELVKRNSGRIEYVDFYDENQFQGLIIEPCGSFVVRLSAHLAAVRSNFYIAHDLGHFLLHWPAVRERHPTSGMQAERRVDVTDQSILRCENEADWFAASFLMPAKEFETQFRKGVAAEAFGVCPSVVKARAKFLGIINPPQETWSL